MLMKLYLPICILLCSLPSVSLSAQPTALEAPLTNEDVVKLATLGLGDDIVVAKIKQVSRIDFKLDTESLVALKQQGVSAAIIAAMLDRDTAKPVAAAPGFAPQPSQEKERVVLLKTNQGDIPLRHIIGDFSQTGIWMVSLIFSDYPGLKARIRTSDPDAFIQIESDLDPTGRLYFVKVEADEDDDVRSLKMGRSGITGPKSISTPDKDWVVPTDVEEEAPGFWRIRPSAPLVPGEYGIWVRGTAGFSWLTIAADQAALYDFGVD